MMYKIIHGTVNLDFNDFFEFSSCGLARNRHSQKLLIPKSRLDCRKYSFACRSVKAWNSLPQEVIDSKNVTIFRRKLKSSNLSDFLMH